MDSEGVDHFTLFGPTDLDNLPEPCWLIEGILPANALGVLYGASGVGKTFVAFSMALSIAAGHPWCGKPTKLGSVLYVAAEGLFGLRLRVQAYQGRHGIAAENIRYLGDAFDLRQAADIKKLISTLEAANFRPDLIVLDTLARLIPGADENSAQDIGKAICAIDELKHKFSATVLVVHHTGKDGGPERGSSALRGAADAMIKCRAKSSDPHVVFLDCDKMKDAEPFRPKAIKLEKVQISATTSSLAVTSSSDAPEAKTLHEEMAQDDEIILAILEKKFPGGALPKQLQEAFMQSTGQSEATFHRFRRAALKRGAIRKHGNKYCANGMTMDGCQVSGGVKGVS
jgi:hypothetical protein